MSLTDSDPIKVVQLDQPSEIVQDAIVVVDSRLDDFMKEVIRRFEIDQDRINKTSLGYEVDIECEERMLSHKCYELDRVCMRYDLYIARRVKMSDPVCAENVRYLLFPEKLRMPDAIESLDDVSAYLRASFKDKIRAIGIKDNVLQVAMLNTQRYAISIPGPFTIETVATFYAGSLDPLNNVFIHLIRVQERSERREKHKTCIIS